MSEREPFVDDFINKLGLAWDVRYVYGSVDRPLLTSSESEREHQLIFPWAHADFTREFRCDFANMLARAKFAEKISPIFAQARFPKGHDIEGKDFSYGAMMVYYSQQLVEVWSADYVEKMLGKDLIEEDVSSWIDVALNIPEQVILDNQMEMILGYSLSRANLERSGIEGYEWGLNKVLGRIVGAFGESGYGLAVNMGEFYSKLPELPIEDREEALGLFASKTQEAAQMLGYPIKVELSGQEGDLVWNFEQA